MAVIRKVPEGSSGGQRSPAKRKPPVKTEGISLPTERSEPPNDLQDYTMLIYGEAGIGKTSLVARFPKVLFFMWETASRGISAYRTDPLTDWEVGLAYVELLKGKRRSE